MKIYRVCLILAISSGILFLALSGKAQTSENKSGTFIAVGQAKTKKPVIALLNPVASKSGDASIALQVKKVIEEDINFLELFRFLPESNFPQTRINSPEELRSEEWNKTDADFVVASEFSVEANQKVVASLRVIRIAGRTDELSKRYSAQTQDFKFLGHALADDLVLAITGKRGIFQTRIAMVCNKTGKKEIYTTAFDGSDLRQVTKLRSLSMAPAWSPDGTRLAFSVFNRHSNNTKNIDLFEMNFKNGKLEMLSNRTGINSGANYHPNGKDLLLTMSYTGDPEIYKLDLQTKRATPVTRSLGVNVDPKYSPDGNRIAFVSSRAGKPMVYVMPDGNPTATKRLTYAGQYNATPAWLPDGNSLIFAGYLEGKFDLFRIKLANDQIDRLTKNEGNNEDPAVSPDGNFVTFTSNRSGGQNVWLMSLDATMAKRLTFGMGQCSAPQWSPYLN